jgi:hypothetical protein
VRFIVRTLDGYPINPGSRYGSKTPGLTVWVADDQWGGREVRVWRSEKLGGSRAGKCRRMFAAAEALADKPEAEHEREVAA